MPIYLNGKVYNDIQIGSKIKADLPELTKPSAGSEQILEGYQAINSSGQIINGQIESYINDEIYFSLIDEVSVDTEGQLIWRDDTNSMVYAYNDLTTFKLDQSAVAEGIGLTADKIVSGNTVLGIAGTHVCSGGGNAGKKWVLLQRAVTPTEGVIAVETNYNSFTNSTIFQATFSNNEIEYTLYAFYDDYDDEWISSYFSSLGKVHESGHFSISGGNILWSLAGSAASDNVGPGLYSGTLSVYVYALI